LEKFAIGFGVGLNGRVSGLNLCDI